MTKSQQTRQTNYLQHKLGKRKRGKSFTVHDKGVEETRNKTSRLVPAWYTYLQ